jgi:RND family efflux transporter MFP subunit
MAKAEVASAQAKLDEALEEQETHYLVAPIDGTILAVNAQVGETISTNPFITLANLSQPMLEVYVDETDLNNIGVGYEIEVIFDALPDEVFTGKIVSIDPSLTNSNMVMAVRGVAQLDLSSFAKPQTLPIGLSASVEVIGSKAEDVLLVPVEAVRELAEGSYAVFVMENGQPRLKVVEVGLMDYTYAEIKSGLSEGDVVTTGIVETAQ